MFVHFAICVNADKAALNLIIQPLIKSNQLDLTRWIVDSSTHINAVLTPNVHKFRAWNVTDYPWDVLQTLFCLLAAISGLSNARLGTPSRTTTRRPQDDVFTLVFQPIFMFGAAKEITKGAERERGEKEKDGGRLRESTMDQNFVW